MTSLLGRVAVELLRPAGDFFRLSLSALGDPGAPLAPAGASAWSPITAAAREVHVRRGGARADVGVEIGPGVLTLVLVNDADPTTDPDLRPNVPIRARVPGGNIFFTGRIEDVDVTRDHRGNRFTQVTAVDAVQTLANTPRFGAVSPAGAETWRQRVGRVMRSTTLPLTQATVADETYLCADTVYESTVRNHLDLATTTGRGAWFVNRAGAVQTVDPRAPAPVIATFSDAPAPGQRSYRDADLRFDTRTVVNRLALDNHGRTQDPETGRWVADDRTLGPFSDVTSVATWGDRLARVDTCHVDDAAVHVAYAGALLSELATAEPFISALTYNATEDVALAAALEVYGRIDATRDGLTQPSLVAGLEHTITPTKWMVHLDLIRQESP